MESAGPSESLAPGGMTGAGPWAVGRTQDGKLFAVSRKCRHLRADLAEGHVDEDGCVVCPWHQSRYEPESGRMVTGPQGVFRYIPGLGAFFKTLTKVVPLKTATVTDEDGELHVVG
ncbi:MAG TPA: Rieske (2Fe-2S) protein [Nitriliruptorales bacterium]